MSGGLEMNRVPLRASTITAYGAPGFVFAALALTFYVFLPKFYADVVGINLTVLGIVVLGSGLALPDQPRDACE
jgi:Na+/melibiose symporter-like transporter